MIQMEIRLVIFQTLKICFRTEKSSKRGGRTVNVLIHTIFRAIKKTKRKNEKFELRSLKPETIP